jgi:glyoxylase-like metal-dependent hydrolase (beta-lactamase superfamily II)
MEVEGVGVLDLNFMGHAGAIASGVLEGPGGLAIVDPGPASTLDGLRAALGARGASLAQVRAVLATHIHLDHFGAAGAIVRENPLVDVYVHERGTPHLVDPSRLVASARRLYGDEMDRLWGEVAPVPASNVRTLRGGERLVVAGREVLVAYTPGHASHHVSYFDVQSGTAFTGDVGGMRVGRAKYAMPPTPPPDIDVELWEESVERIRQWRPRALFLTHFGLVDSPEQHLADLVEHLRWFAALVRESLQRDGADADRLTWFKKVVALELRRQMPEEVAASFERAVPIDDSWHGLARYWRKRPGRGNVRA